MREYAIVSDFDGTITVEDSNDTLFSTLGGEENAQIEADFLAGAVGNRATMVRHFDALRISQGAYEAFLDEAIHVDPAFDEFLQRARAAGLPFYIVSAGFRQGIRRILGEARLAGVQVLANDLRGDGYLMPAFAMEQVVCTESIGPCGNCKKACVDMIREQVNRKIIYIGDGMTDRCVIRQADLLFAKDALAAYCGAQDLPYVPFAGFADVSRYLWPE